MILTLTAPQSLSSLLTVHEDKTTWRPGDYRGIRSKADKSAGQTPKRCRASFSTWSRSLVPNSPLGEALARSFGIYILSFTQPSLHHYVGIAAGDSRSAEGILNRIKKHRVKATASHVGARSDTNGGVDHTSGWRCFAEKRATSLQGATDTCADATLIVGTISSSNHLASSRDQQSKKKLQYFEACIFTDANGSITKINNLLGGRPHEWITTRTGSVGVPRRWSISYWDGATITV